MVWVQRLEIETKGDSICPRGLVETLQKLVDYSEAGVHHVRDFVV